MKRKQLVISVEDWKVLANVSPSIVKLIKSYFFVDIEPIRSQGLSIVRLTYRYYATQPKLKRGFYSLIHSLHVIACDLFRRGDFSDYLVFDSFMFLLIRML